MLSRSIVAVAATLCLACASDVGQLTSVAAPSALDRFAEDEWGDPVHLPPPINSTARELGAALAPDELSIYFGSDRAGGVGAFDIWVSRRACRTCEWGPAVNLGPSINSPTGDGSPAFSPDGHVMFFSGGARLGGFGGEDIWMTRRADANDDLGWEAPVNLGPLANTADDEQGTGYAPASGGGATLYFNRSGDIYHVDVSRDGEVLSAATRIAEVSHPTANDVNPTVRADGREMYFWSNRPGSLGIDLWVSTRQSPSAPWSAPVNVHSVNTVGPELAPSISHDGRTLLLAVGQAGRPSLGFQDIWMFVRKPGSGHSASLHATGPEWDTPVNLGAVVNSSFADFDPFISRDGLSLYFSAGQQRGGLGLRDLWLSVRSNRNGDWGAPINLVALNSSGHDSKPTLSDDGLQLYFASTRVGGQFDLYVSTRTDRHDPLGWSAPVPLPPGINSSADEESGVTFHRADPGSATTMYFASNRPGGPGSFDIYSAVMAADGTFGPVTLVPELSSSTSDIDPVVSTNGLEVYFASERAGGFGAHDLWSASRHGTSGAWSAPVNLGPEVNSPTRTGAGQSNDRRPSLSLDGRTLYFAAALRPGNVGDMYDIWASTRKP